MVREAESDDLLSVLGLMSRSDEGLGSSVEKVPLREQATWQEMLSTQNLTVYVAEFEGAVVGTASFLLTPNLGYECQPSGFIEAMVVAAHVRRKGVARKIVERILEDACNGGARKIQLLAHKRHEQDGAHAFYRSMGFESEAEGFRLYLSS